eukprot:g5970.t1
MGQTMASSQFFLYGKKHFTQTGYAKHAAKYTKAENLENLDLAGRRFVVTGANSGIGKEISKSLFNRNGKVYMVCRNADRAEKARQEILAGAEAAGAGKEDRLVAVIGDCSLKEGIRDVAAAVGKLEPAGVDALVCNAGALLNERTLTAEGFETTFACHLLFGTYGLAKAMEPSLRACAARGGQPRTIFVSSGGMYNTKWPAWEVGTSAETSPAKYDGVMAYAYAKRAQVLLAQRFAESEAASAAEGGESKQSDDGGLARTLEALGEDKGEDKKDEGGAKTKILGAPIQYVSCHPGWTDTPGVDAAFGSQAKYLKPLRTLWEGAEGICWLCTAEADRIKPGAFYLDREPQHTHMAGPFFSEGSFTKNTAGEVDQLLQQLADASGL